MEKFDSCRHVAKSTSGFMDTVDFSKLWNLL